KTNSLFPHFTRFLLSNKDNSFVRQTIPLNGVCSAHQKKVVVSNIDPATITIGAATSGMAFSFTATATRVTKCANGNKLSRKSKGFQKEIQHHCVKVQSCF